MRSISSLRKFTILLTALLAGICLFTAVATAKLESSLFNSELHKSLLDKCNIYTQTSSILKASLEDYLKTVDPGSPDNIKQQEQLVNFIEKAITPEMIKLNIDSIIDGLLKYIKSETRFLPDVYIKMVQDKPVDELQTDKDKDDRVSADALTDIDKINLSVILMYMNRSDITDKLSVARLMQFLLVKVPSLAGLLFSVFLCCGLLLMKSKRELTVFIKASSLTCGLISFLSGISLYVYLYYILPYNDTFISLSVPLQPESAVLYLQSLLNSSAIFLASSGVIMALLIPALMYFIKNAIKLNKSILLKAGIRLVKHKVRICGRQFGIKALAAAASLIFTIILSFTYYSAYKSEFLSKDLTVAVERMRGITSFSRVVYAQDAAVNTLELRIMDRKENKPVQGIYTNISGKSSKNGDVINEEVTSDGEGKSKTTLDIGSYKLSFDSETFPDNYKLPPPYLFEMSAAGSTVITISLDKQEEPLPGTIEVQVLDKDNLPVKGIQLAMVSEEPAEGQTSETPTNSFSFTNSEGVAAFRTHVGIYKVTFLEEGFPADYVLPESIETDLDPDETARYSIKLALAQKKQ